MIITKVADKEGIPAWMNNGLQNSSDSRTENTIKLDISDITEMDDNAIAKECDKIEACVSQGTEYACSEEWPSRVISHLHEYAVACGMHSKQFLVVSSTRNRAEHHAEKQESMQRFAAKSTTQNASEDDGSIPTKDKLLSVMSDPFHIDERADTSHMEEENWEQVKPEARMSDAPVIMGNSIIALRGGENYNLNREAGVAKGQNSIVNPGAIEELAKSDDMTPGERLAVDNARRAEERQQEKGSWEEDRILAMTHKSIIPHGKVFPTETLNAQPGLQHQPSMFKPKEEIPDKTAGEQLAKQNEAHRQSIQREHVEDDWERPHRASSRSISDVFGEELQKHLRG